MWPAVHYLKVVRNFKSDSFLIWHWLVQEDYIHPPLSVLPGQGELVHSTLLHVYSRFISIIRIHLLRQLPPYGSTFWRYSPLLLLIYLHQSTESHTPSPKKKITFQYQLTHDQILSACTLKLWLSLMMIGFSWCKADCGHSAQNTT